MYTADEFFLSLKYQNIKQEPLCGCAYFNRNFHKLLLTLCIRILFFPFFCHKNLTGNIRYADFKNSICYCRMMAVTILIYNFHLISSQYRTQYVFQTVIVIIICDADNCVSFRRNLFQISCYLFASCLFASYNLLYH